MIVITILFRYIANFGPDFIIDASKYGSLPRFASHSCDPNCKLEITLRKKNGKLALGMFATKEIPSNHEITLDYAWTLPESDAHNNVPCQCKSAKCRKTLFKIKYNSKYCRKVLRPSGAASRQDRTYYMPGGKQINSWFYFYSLLLSLFNITSEYVHFDADASREFRCGIRRIVSDLKFEVQVGNFVKLYYNAFTGMQQHSQYNSIMKVLLFSKDPCGHSYGYGCWFR